MSRKVKSEIDFVLKVLILFLILFANKLHKSTNDGLTTSKTSVHSMEDSPMVKALIRYHN